MDYFHRNAGALFCEEVPLKELAGHFGTPLYVYSYATLQRHFHVYAQALSGLDHLICYAAKANDHLAILRAIGRMGGGADVVSGGELYRCLEAGIRPSKIVFSGVGKTIEELQYAVRQKLFMINVESEWEYNQLEEISEALDLEVGVSFRLNPDVDPNTHPYISTGLRENKFGLPKQKIMRLYERAKQHSHIIPKGLDFHIGSQLTEVAPFFEAVEIALGVVRELRSMGISLEAIDLGGGLGVTYLDESPPSPKEYLDALRPLLLQNKLKVILEPGRSIIGNAGVLLTRVIHVKSTEDKNFVIVDAGMNDLIRPALYGAKHKIEVVQDSGSPTLHCDVVGPICETGDFLAKDIDLPEPSSGDLICVRTAGAYGFTMANHYNSRPKPAAVLVNGNRFDLIHQRETFEDMMSHERIPDWLGEEL